MCICLCSFGAYRYVEHALGSNGCTSSKTKVYLLCGKAADSVPASSLALLDELVIAVHVILHLVFDAPTFTDVSSVPPSLEVQPKVCAATMGTHAYFALARARNRGRRTLT